MRIKYRRRIKIAPGVNLNISKSGVSTTIGLRGASVNIGKNGTYLNTGIPGTGLYDRNKISGDESNNMNASSNSGFNGTGCIVFGIIFALSLLIVVVLTNTLSGAYFLLCFVVSAIISALIAALGLTSSSKVTEYKQKTKESLLEQTQKDTNTEHVTTAVLDSIFNNTTTRRISKDSYELFESEAESLYEFLKSSQRSIKFRNEVDRMMDVVNSDGSPWLIKEKMLLCMQIDAYRCFEGLGYELNKNDIETLCLSIYGAKLLNSKKKITFDLIEEFKRNVMPSMISVFDTAVEGNGHMLIPKGQFFFQHVFENINKEKMSEYMVRMYRFASAMAKADGTVDERESEYLALLLQSRNLATDGTELNAKANKKVTNEQKADVDTIDEVTPFEELNSLIGLKSVKEEVEKLTNYIKIMKVREKQGLPTTPVSYHCVFTGNPGTGKTTVARILASIYKDLGVITKGHLVETDRSGLVAEYVGQTAVKTNKIIDSALDGVLFIDEAYSLVNGSSSDYGLEAISTLLKRMEDDRDRLVVILAGYDYEMQIFINSNPGLQSRFNRYVNFPDYDDTELLVIYKRNLEKHKYILDKDAEQYVANLLAESVASKDKNFGNARYVRNIFEKTLENQAMRLAGISKLTSEMLCTITLEDVMSLK